ncbi:MAG TPA: PfkB family carbohydrate kinase [Chloroflexota bacterium]
MSVLVVGSLGLDDVETPFGRVNAVLGGTVAHFSLAASLYTRVQVVAVVGEDFPPQYLDLFRQRNIDLGGLQQRPGKTFRWKARYEFDLNVAHTLDTQLNVFAEFHPLLPESYRSAPFVFLANIDPRLQLEVLDQVASPRLVALDSMNFWIERSRPLLTEVMRRVHLVLLNEAEVRQYADTHNLYVAARRILSLGPRALVVKKGEHGAMLIERDGEVFVVPALPLTEVVDPTGAGDSFAGGFMGYLASTGDLSPAGLRRAMVHGSATASFAVQDFSVRRLVSLTRDEMHACLQAFRRLTHFEME